MRIENPLSALLWGYGVFQSREDFSDSLGALELAYRRCRVRNQKDILPCQSATLCQSEKLCQSATLRQSEKLRQSGKLRQSEKFRQNATLMPPTMRPVIPMPSSTKPRTLWPPAWTQTAPA